MATDSPFHRAGKRHVERRIDVVAKHLGDARNAVDPSHYLREAKSAIDELLRDLAEPDHRVKG